jgi:hypothetical protein
MEMQKQRRRAGALFDEDYMLSVLGESNSATSTREQQFAGVQAVFQEGREEERSPEDRRDDDGGFSLEKLGFDMTQNLIFFQPNPRTHEPPAAASSSGLRLVGDDNFAAIAQKRAEEKAAVEEAQRSVTKANEEKATAETAAVVKAAVEKAAADAKVVILANISQLVCVLSKSTVWFWGMEIIEVETILKFFRVSLSKMETDLLDRKSPFPFPGRTL